MFSLILWSTIIILVKSQKISGHCIDIHSQVVSQGLHYVPGPNTCTLCICDKGSPKWCKSVLCSPPQNCKSFQVGNTCCEFKCLDDILTSDGYKNTYDLALRLVASAFTALLSLSILFFLYHRLRRRKIRLRQNRQTSDDQRSLNSIGYIAGSLGYHPGNYGYLGTGNSDMEFPYEDSTAHYSLWKPPGNYFPRGEAPPPYEEAVRLAQMENENLNNQVVPPTNTVVEPPNHNPSYTVNTPQPAIISHQQYQNGCCVLLTRTENSTNSNDNNKEHVNIPVTSSISSHIIVDKSNSNKPEPSSTSRNIHSKSNSSEEGKEKSKSYENIFERNANPPCLDNQRSSCIYTNQMNEASNIYLQNKLQNGILKKTYIPTETANKKYKIHKDSRHRTISKTFLVKNKIPPMKDFDVQNLIKDYKKEPQIYLSKDSSYHRTLPANLKDINLSLNLCLDQIANGSNSESFNFKTISKKESDITTKASNKQMWNTLYIPNDKKKPILVVNSKPPKENIPCTSTSIEGQLELLQARSPSSKPESYISYHCLSSQDDDDDYRSECENCKFAEVTNGEEEILNETMTLHRRPIDLGEEFPYYRTSLTLPTNSKKPSRILNKKPGRENWFLTMDEYSSSDDSS